jgi:hypothetical protein
MLQLVASVADVSALRDPHSCKHARTTQYGIVGVRACSTDCDDAEPWFVERLNDQLGSLARGLTNLLVLAW